MAYLLDLVYVIVLTILTPLLCFRAMTTGRYRRGLAARLFGHVTHPLLADDGRQVVWFHGVSVGEIHLLRALVARFRERFPQWRCVISTTTDTGHDEACKSFPDLAVLDWPFDFTWAVGAALRCVRPNLVVLAEGEIWPNFVRAATRAGVQLAIVNGRMSPRSAARFLKVRWLMRRMFARFALVAAQTEEYRRHYEALGARRAVATGNVKYDGVQTDRDNPRSRALAALFGIQRGTIVWVAGSTQDPEERLCLDAYAKARLTHPELRLIIVPRHRERFEEVALLLEQTGLPFTRRSRLTPAQPAPEGAVILGDSMGELGAIWGLADIAFVGGSLDGKRGGQNMIEPAAYGSAVLFGPHTWNFKDTVVSLLMQNAAVQVPDAAALQPEVRALLNDADRRAQLGRAARHFVLSQQGATARTLDLLAEIMQPNETAVAA